MTLNLNLALYTNLMLIDILLLILFVSTSFQEPQQDSQPTKPSDALEFFTDWVGHVSEI